MSWRSSNINCFVWRPEARQTFFIIVNGRIHFFLLIWMAKQKKQQLEEEATVIDLILVFFVVVVAWINVST